MSSSPLLDRLRSNLRKVLEGKDELIDRVLIGMLAGGHVLLEDVPGVGKTTLAKGLARLFDMSFSRIQFTPDLLPSDILGGQVLNPKEGTFSFHRGPIFAHVLLADEVNRASPRTQSALLEAMNEGQVTVDGHTHQLPAPFFVIATQNPADFSGTYPLPEAQLDRFLMRLAIGYPSEEAELRMLLSHQRAEPVDALAVAATREELLEQQRAVRDVLVRDDVARYMLRVTKATRESRELELGVSPRGVLALFRAAQARAALLGRAYVSPADVQALAGPVLAHRVRASAQARHAGRPEHALIDAIVRATPVPT